VGVLITHRVQAVTEDDGRITFTINPFSGGWHGGYLPALQNSFSRGALPQLKRERDHPEGSLGLEGAARAAQRLARVSSLLALPLLSLLSSFVLAQPCWRFLVRRASTTQLSQGGGRPGCWGTGGCGGRTSSS